MIAVVVGCGGIGTRLAPLLATYTTDPSRDRLILIDPDKVEQKNLSRQPVFGSLDVGKPKVQCMSRKLAQILAYPAIVQSRTEKFDTNFPLNGDVVFGCVDNHDGRCSVLEFADRTGAKAIIACNEVTEAEAYYYDPKWKNSPADPRKFYPELIEKRSVPGHSCGAGPEQSSLANSLAASFACWLFHLWLIRFNDKTSSEAVQSAPIHIHSSFGRIWTTSFNQRIEEEKESEKKTHE